MSLFDDYWTNAAGGDYGTAGNWSEMVPYAPNPSEVAVLGQVGTSTADYTVTTSAATGGFDQLGALQISSYATLEFLAGDYTAADQLNVTNAGTIKAFGLRDVYPGLDIIFSRGTFTNSGTVDFIGGAIADFGDASSLNFEGTVINTGLIESNGVGGLLNFQGGALTNQGQILSEGASDTSTTDDLLVFSKETINNTGGVIGATKEGLAIIGSGVALSGGTLTGTVDFDALNASSVLDDVTIASTTNTSLNVQQSYIAGSGDYDEVEGTINNEGTVFVFPQLGVAASALAIEGDVTLTGGGRVWLSDIRGGAAIVSASGSSELYNDNNVIEGSGQIESANGGTLTLVNGAGGRIESGIELVIGVGTIGQFVEHIPNKNAGPSDLDIDTGQLVTNQGVIETGVNSTMTIDDAVDNTGHIAANWDALQIDGAVTGSGLDSINRAELTFESSVSSGQEVLFNINARLELGDASAFQGVLTGFGADDKIFLDGFNSHKIEPLSWTANAGGGVLTVSDGAHIAELDFSGSYNAASFKIGGTNVQTALTFV